MKYFYFQILTNFGRLFNQNQMYLPIKCRLIVTSDLKMSEKISLVRLLIFSYQVNE